METIKNVVSWIFEWSLTVVLGIIMVVAFLYCFSLGLTTVGGLLFGFSNPSPICNAYFSKTITVGEMLVSPVTPYACQPNSGILTNVVHKVGTYLDKPWYVKEK